jgi:integrase
MTLQEFVERKFLPFQLGKWKKSTAGTSGNRIRHHVVKGLGGIAVKDFLLTSLQAFLDKKAREGFSFSVVDHLRWDLSAIFEMAVAEKVIATNPTTRLYTPKQAPKGQTRAMSVEQVKTALAAVELREQVLLHMAIFSGFRPGEMLGLQRRHVAAEASAVKVEQRVYRGIVDDPKTDPSRREGRFRRRPPSCFGNGWSLPWARSRKPTCSPEKRESRSGGTRYCTTTSGRSSNPWASGGWIFR